MKKHPSSTAFGLLAAVVFSLFQTPARAADELWITDFAKARESAAAGKKDILMDFTGSDWCGWCIQLKKEVFDKAAFKKEAPKNFILLEVDFPQEKELPKKQQEQNEKLRDDFHIEGYPTIVLADAAGKPYAKTGYQEGGPTEYLKHLGELRAVREKRDAAFALAEKAEGIEKAKHLSEGLKALEDDIVDVHYATVVDQIIALDKDDTLGLKKKREFNAATRQLQEKLQALHGEEKFDEYAKTLEAFIAEHKLEGEQKQRALMMKMPLFDESKLDDAEKLLNEVLKIDEKSETAQQARDIIEQINDIRAQQKEDAKDGKKPGADEAEKPTDAPAEKEKEKDADEKQEK